MKNKNDFRDQNGDLRIEVTKPAHCHHCGYDSVERVELHATNSRPFIRRLADQSGLSRFFPKQHHLYGWRCVDCGHVMWFTAKFLD